MPSGLPTASFRLSNLLASPFEFSVPPYQRSYSWSVREAGQLLEDLATAAGLDGAGEGEPDYFLSSIVLLSTQDERNGGRRRLGARLFDIVDGQQRLITLTLLAAVLRSFETHPSSKLRDKLGRLIFVDGRASGPEANHLRVELRGRERVYFEHLAALGPAAADDFPRDDMMTLAEMNLSAVRDHFAAELSQLDEDERAQLATYICDRCHFVVIFTGDIDRAHRMFTVLNERGRRLQRNDILKAEVLRRTPPAKEAQAALQWDLASGLLGGEFELFFSHMRSLYGKQKPQVVAGVRAIIDEVGGAERFLDQVMAPLANAYHLILRADNPSLRIDDEVRRRLLYLSRLSGQEWAPAALLVLTRHAGDAKRARRLMAEIDRLAHVLRVLCLGNGKRVTRFNAVVESIKDGSALESDAKAFRLSKDEVKAIGYNLRDLHRRNPQICKLVLLRINDALAGGLAAVDLAGVTVEHVLPHRPSGMSEWRKWYPAPEDRSACAECLGNLVLVSPKQNDRARNQDFARKQKIYGAAEEAAAGLAITREAVAASSWRPKDVRAREARFLRLLADMWGIEIEGAGPGVTKAA